VGTLHHQKYTCLLYDLLNWVTPGQSTTSCLQLFGILWWWKKLLQAGDCII